MPFPGQRLSILLSVILTLAAVSPAFGATLDRDAFRWQDEYGQGSFRDGQVLPGRLALRFAPGTEPARTVARGDGSFVSGNFALDQVAAQLGVQTIEPLFDEIPAGARIQSTPERDSWYFVQFDPSNSSVLEAAEAFAQLDGVIAVEPDPVHEMHANLPNDPSLASQWWLRNTNLGGGDIRAVGAWSFATGDPSVLVAVADSGVDWKHPELGGTGPDYVDGVIFTNTGEYGGQPGIDDDGNGKVDDVRGWDFVNGLNYFDTWQTPTQDISIEDPDPMDYGGHGTAVSGCIAAITNNGVGIASINWNARILPCRVGWTTETGQGVIGMQFAARGMDYARIMGADVYNASWGSSPYGPLITATNLAVAAGMVIVTSAGNDNDAEASYLASRSDVVSVAATNSGDSRASFSSYGVWVDISAPGQGIFTTGFNVSAAGSAQHVYTTIDGTSFSSPIVCGAMALAKSVYPGDTRQQLIDRVLAATDNIDAQNPGYVGKLGSGRLNLTKLFYEGSVWPVPGMMPQIVDAMQAAAPGDTVAVEGGHTMNGPFLFSGINDIHILGGYDGSYTTRDPVGDPSVMQIPIGSGTVVTITAGVGPGFVLDGFVISGGRVTSPSLAPEVGFYGGGLRIYDSSPVLRNLLVTGNQAGASVGADGFGGGIAILSANPTLENVEITGNQALSGAGLYIYDSAPTLTNINVHSNTAWDGAGALDPFGGGLYVRQSPPAGARRAGPLVIDGGNFSGNDTPGSGGGMYLNDSDVELSGVTVADNTSIGAGAGVSASLGSPTIGNSVFTNNTITPSGALAQGGGLHTLNAAVSVDSTEFRQNTSTLAGGGDPPGHELLNVALCGGGEHCLDLRWRRLRGVRSPPSMSILGNTVANNGGGSVGGNGFYISGGSADPQSNVVAFNTGGATNANGINVLNSTVTFNCNLFHGNGGASPAFPIPPGPTGTSTSIPSSAIRPWASTP